MSTDPFGRAAELLRLKAIEAGRAHAADDTQHLEALLGDLEERLRVLNGVVDRLEQAVRSGSGTPPLQPEGSNSPTPGKTVPPRRKPAPATAPPEGAETLPEGWTIVSLCEKLGLETVDRRDVPGGSLWVLGEENATQKLFGPLAAVGVTFTFSPTGSRATGRKPGWFTKSIR